MYYILLKNDDIKNPNFSPNVLGEVSFKNFWTDDGFKALQQMIQKYPDNLEEVVIKDQNNKSYSVEQFLDKLNGLRIIQ
jgi:hypothetical protein